MKEEEWARFLHGEQPHTRRACCRLDRDLVRALRASTDIVKIERNYALKSAHKHGLHYSHFPMAAIAIEFGVAIADRPNHLTFVYDDRAVFGTWFMATVKSTQDGNELWLVTFHRYGEADVRRRLKRDEMKITRWFKS